MGSNDTHLKYDSRTELLQGCDSNGNLSGRLYNRYIDPENTTLFKIWTGEAVFTAEASIASFKYDYIYY